VRKILHIHNQSLPPSPNSGGSNRLIDWLATEQSKQGHSVCAISPEGRSNDFYEHIKMPANCNYDELIELIPEDVTDIEYHGGLDAGIVDKLLTKYPSSLQIIHAGKGGGKNNVFVSRSHAEQAGQTVFAYNGLPVDDYIFSESKSDYLLFIAKVKRRKKGADTAIKLAKKLKCKLIVAGGSRLYCPETWFNWHPLISPVGYVNGTKKFELLSQAKALIVPIRWEEPFGLTIVEAMLSGTPVIAFNRGAMKELIIDGVTGFLCDTEEEMLAAIKNVSKLSAKQCHEHAKQYFSSVAMYEKHEELLALAGAGKSW